jgi:hypothetical protein
MFSRLRSLLGLRNSREADAVEPDFRAGDIWRYHTRSSEPDSTLTVLRVDRDAGSGNIVHLRVDGLRIRNPHHPAGFSGEIMHMPFEPAAVARSVTVRLERDAAVPDFAEGYAEWRRAFDADEAGVFSVTVAEAVEVMERAINA